MVGEPHEREALLQLDARRPERLDRHAQGDGAVVADRLAHRLEQLEQEARAVLERAAVLVRALVVEGREELERQVAVPAVDVDDVEPGLARPLGAAHPVVADPRDLPASRAPSGR